MVAKPACGILDTADRPQTIAMASKRNSRAYIDEGHESSLFRPLASSHRSRRDSRASLKDDTPQVAQDTEEAGGRAACCMARDATVKSRSRSTSGGGRETTALGTSSTKTGDQTAAAPAKVHTTAARSAGFPAVPIIGRPVNFGVVLPGVYRSGYPKTDDFDFLQSLKLKTVITLAKKDDLNRDLVHFIKGNGIRQVIFNMRGTKKEEIPVSTMASILELVLNPANYPLLVHCNHGKHRTGCIVAVVRKLSGWDLDSTLDEYRSYAAPKIRECDIDYISGFESSSLQALTHEPAQFNPVQVKTFFRTLLFSTFVVVLWLVSGSQMHSQPGHVAA